MVYNTSYKEKSYEMMSCFSGMKIIETGLKHRSVTVVSDGESVEVITYRIDDKYNDNIHPEIVSFTVKVFVNIFLKIL